MSTYCQLRGGSSGRGEGEGVLHHYKIVAAFRGMHVSPAKHSYASVADGQTDRQTDGRTDGRTTDKVIPMCRYASQVTQKMKPHNGLEESKLKSFSQGGCNGCLFNHN